MKVIDLLNKIANGEEVPKRIRYKGDCWYLKQNYANRLPYYSNGYDKDNLFTGEEEDYFSHSLNDEVEIIEEDKKIEKFKDYIPIGLTSVGADFIKKDVFEALLKIGDKINEIIDCLNKGDK